MATNPSIVSPFGGQLEADDAPEGGPDGVFVDDFNHVCEGLSLNVVAPLRGSFGFAFLGSLALVGRRCN